MGMSYDELGVYGRLRKVVRCGPVAMFRHCCQLWRDKYAPEQVADKVRGVAVWCDAGTAEVHAGGRMRLGQVTTLFGADPQPYLWLGKVREPLAELSRPPGYGRWDLCGSPAPGAACACTHPPQCHHPLCQGLSAAQGYSTVTVQKLWEGIPNLGARQ